MTALKSWAETLRPLIHTAMGRTKADMVIRKGRWVNVHSARSFPAPTLPSPPGASPMLGPMPRTPSGRIPK